LSFCIQRSGSQTELVRGEDLSIAKKSKLEFSYDAFNSFPPTWAQKAEIALSNPSLKGLSTPILAIQFTPGSIIDFIETGAGNDSIR
jgi:hypothetical protein